jgi:hypothetical protein
MRFASAIFLVACSVLVHAEGPAKKPAWEWSLDERIAKLDPESIRERAAAEERWLRGGLQVRAPEPIQFVVDGKRDPELLMPFEIFGSILMGVDPRWREDTRRQYRDKIAAFGWPEEVFWKTLEEAASEHTRYQDESIELQMKLRTLSPPEHRKLESRIEKLGYQACHARADAFQKVRVKLGAEAFDRFLYGAVAPEISIGSALPVGDEAERLRFVEGGCR